MNKDEVSDKIKLKKHAVSLEDDPNRLAKLQNDLKILEFRYQIELYRERIKLLSDN
jgi:hypothetical protein